MEACVSKVSRVHYGATCVSKSYSKISYRERGRQETNGDGGGQVETCAGARAMVRQNSPICTVSTSNRMEANFVKQFSSHCHQRSRLHRMLNTGWKFYDAADGACPEVRTLNTLSQNLAVLRNGEDSKCCLVSSICGPVCPSKMFPSSNKNSSTI